MLPWIVALTMTGAAGYMSINRTREITKGEKEIVDRRKTTLKDNLETGMKWDIERVTDLHLTNMNAAHQPYSAPVQTPTYDLSEVAFNASDRTTFLSVYGPDFFFRNNTEIPYTSAQSASFSIELPSNESIRGDPGASLSRNPRVYYENSKPKAIYANYNGTTGANGASEAEIWDEEYVPETGQLNSFMYPFGVGGAIQRLHNKKNEQRTRKNGTDQSVLLSPPLWSFNN